MRAAFWYFAVGVWGVALAGGLVAGWLGSGAVLVLVPVAFAAAGIVVVMCYGPVALLRILLLAVGFAACVIALGRLMPEPLAELLVLATAVAVLRRRRVIWRRRVARAMDRITFV
jgi:hypothetical protein